MEGKGEIVIYKANNRKAQLDVKLEQDTVWLTQKQMAQLFNKSISTISEHLRNIYKEKELLKNSTIRNFRIVQKEGDRIIERDVECFNLDVIISVGYRVKSKEGTQFRIWATSVLRQHLVQGYSVNEKRIEELARKWEEHKEKYERVRYFLERFLSQVARKDVQDKLIDEVEDMKIKHRTLDGIIKKLERKYGKQR